MKIVNEQPFNYEFTCKSCGSVLIAEAADVTIGYFGANHGGDRPERRYYVSCEVCGTIKTLEDSEVPPKVQHLAETKREGKK